MDMSARKVFVGVPVFVFEHCCWSLTSIFLEPLKLLLSLWWQSQVVSGAELQGGNHRSQRAFSLSLSGRQPILLTVVTPPFKWTAHKSTGTNSTSADYSTPVQSNRLWPANYSTPDSGHRLLHSGTVHWAEYLTLLVRHPDSGGTGCNNKRNQCTGLNTRRMSMGEIFMQNDGSWSVMTDISSCVAHFVSSAMISVIVDTCNPGLAKIRKQFNNVMCDFYTWQVGWNNYVWQLTWTVK